MGSGKEAHGTEQPSINVTHHWNAPLSTAFVHTRRCDLNAELASGQPLPVVHMHDPPTPSATKRPRGLWFYYAAGCSDVLWDPGKQFVARQ